MATRSVFHPSVHQDCSQARDAIEIELAAVLRGSCFRASLRSCQFLRHIVESFLDGRMDLLKERMIGVIVFRREASYDTGADAAVRVRATDVRRRLATHYGAHSPRNGLRIELPLGCYVPRFVAETEDRAVVTFLPGSTPSLIIEGASSNAIRRAAQMLAGSGRDSGLLQRLTSSSRPARASIAIAPEQT